jgi:hypothetical protein
MYKKKDWVLLKSDGGRVTANKKINAATCRKVASSIPDESIGFLSIDLILPAALWPNGFIQPLTEAITRNLPGFNSGRRVRLTTSPPSVVDYLENVEASTPHNPLGFRGLLLG